MFDFEAKKSIIKQEIEAFEHIFSQSFTAEDDLLDRALHHLITQKGKRLRPILVILGAKTCGDINDNTYFIASSYELLHTASLIHDDVIDNSDQRRGIHSLNKIFDNKTAVLVGDYLMAKSFNYIYLTKEVEQVGVLQKLSEDIVRGELLQQQHSLSIPSEKDYSLIIKHKTAALFATCLQAGAMSVRATAQQIDTMYRIGENLGMCFQIKDDIFDYSTNTKLGKPTFNDITEGKVTLPLLYATQSATSQERTKIEQILQKDIIEEADKIFVAEIVQKYKGIDYSEKKMKEYRDVALGLLATFSESEYTDFIKEIINFSAYREF